MAEARPRRRSDGAFRSAAPRGYATLSRNRRIAQLQERSARASDREALAAFTCSRGPRFWYEEEVQDYIRQEALARALRPVPSVSLLLYELDGELVAVGAHRPVGLTLVSGEVIEAAYIEVVAIDREHQGTTLPSGQRLSDVVLRSLARRACSEHRTEVVTALVALENRRSSEVCERNGLRFATLRDDNYARLIGRFR